MIVVDVGISKGAGTGTDSIVTGSDFHGTGQAVAGSWACGGDTRSIKPVDNMQKGEQST